MTASNLTRRAQVLMAGVNALFHDNRNKRALKLNEAVDLLAAADGHRNRHAAIAAAANGEPPGTTAAAPTSDLSTLSIAELRQLSEAVTAALAERTATHNRRDDKTSIETRHRSIPVVRNGPVGLTHVGLRGCINEVELFLVNCWHEAGDFRWVVLETYGRLVAALADPKKAWHVTRTDIHVVEAANAMETRTWAERPVPSCYDTSTYRVRPLTEWFRDWVETGCDVYETSHDQAIAILKARRADIRRHADGLAMAAMAPLERGYELLRNGAIVGGYQDMDSAMAAAQDLGMLRPAADDEGGSPYMVLDNGHEIRPVG